MKMKPVWLSIASVLLLATTSAWADPGYCADLNREVDSWEAYLESYGSAVLVDPAGILAYGDTVTNGNDRVLSARHKTDVSTIFVKNYNGDFIRAATSVPDGVAGSHQVAVGTTLLRSGLAWTALSGGASYCGAVTLFGNSFDSVYRPIKNNGAVIGALYVGDAAP
jgi:hypothetical protein